MSDMSIEPAAKPPIEVALGSDLPSPECPLVVVNPGRLAAMTVVVLRDVPASFYEQTQRARPNISPVVRQARKLLLLEADPECAAELSAMIGRSEGRVAVCVPGTIDMPKAISSRLGTVRDSMREQDRLSQQRIEEQREAMIENMKGNVRPDRRPYFAR